MPSYLTKELLELSRSPKHNHKIKNPTHEMDQENVLCGDSIDIQLMIKEGVITKAGFTGAGCILVMASGSKLISKIINKEVKNIDLNENSWLESFKPAIPVGRQKCVLLAIATLRQALSQE